MDVRPFFLLSQSYIAGLKSRIHAIVQQWENSWGVQFPDTLQIHSPLMLQSHDRQGTWQAWTGQAGLSLLVKGNELEQFCDRLLFASRRQASLADRHLESGLAPIVAKQAAMDFLQQVLCAISEVPYQAECREKSVVLADEIFQPGADAVLICWVEANGRSLNIVATGLPMPNTRSLGRPNQSWRQALGKQHLQLKVELGQVELTVGQIETLHLGDVVKLEQPLDKPLLVRDDKGEPIFQGHPGKQHGHRAISLIKLKA